jgi:acyl-CoA synthetase (AMP-forming)/AMP-acid ligase II
VTKFPNESIGKGKITKAEQVLRDKEVEFGEIPRTSAGKVQKYLLRQKEREKFKAQKGVPRV